jgi:hypothetical protein
MPTATSSDTSAEYETAQEDGDTAVASRLAPLSEAEFMELLVELCADFAPRRFALGEVYGDYDDGRVFAWGLAFEKQAVLCSDDGWPIGVFPSAERALTRLSRRGNLRLVWIDRGPDPDGEV